jgi:hypothetical protein
MNIPNVDIDLTTFWLAFLQTGRPWTGNRSKSPGHDHITSSMNFRTLKWSYCAICFGGISPYTLHRSYIWYLRFSHQWSLTSSKAKSSFKTSTSSSLLNTTVVNHQWPLFSCVELPKGTLVHRWKPQIRFGFREKGKYQDQTRKIFKQDILKTSSCFLFPPCRVNNHIPIGMHHQLQMTRLSHS